MFGNGSLMECVAFHFLNNHVGRHIMAPGVKTLNSLKVRGASIIGLVSGSCIDNARGEHSKVSSSTSQRLSMNLKG